MKLVEPKKAKRNTKTEENSAIAYLAWLREFLTAAGGAVDAESLEEHFLEKFGSTFSEADKAKWRNTLAWAIVSSRNSSLDDSMERAGLPSSGGIFLAKVKVPKQRKHSRLYVIDTVESELLDTARQQLEARQEKTLKRKSKRAPYLDPKRPWFNCPHCERLTYFGLRKCVLCSVDLPKNPRTKVFRR